MDDYAGRVLADRYRLPLPPSDEYELVETRAFDTYSGQEVLVRQVPLPEVVDAEVLDADGLPTAARRAGGRTVRRSTDPAVRRAIEAAQAAAQVPDHPRLDQVFDVFAEAGSLWIVSELVAARPLAALLAERPLNPYRAAEIGSDVLTALRVLHAHGWTHRNITVRTVLICDDGRVVLTGLAAGAAEEALCGYVPVPRADDDGEDGYGAPAVESGPTGPYAPPAVEAGETGPQGLPAGTGPYGLPGAGPDGYDPYRPPVVEPERADPYDRPDVPASRGPGAIEAGTGGGPAQPYGAGELESVRRPSPPVPPATVPVPAAEAGSAQARAARAGAIAAYRAGARAAEPETVLGAFLRALGTADSAIPDSLDERAALYRSTLDGRRILVLLDNAHDAAQIRPLLPGTAGCAALVTSRVRMVDLAGAHLVDLDVMSPEEALQLFTRIVGEERINSEREAALDVVAACGFLPLAIRIAASRLAARRTWTVSVLAAKLADERRRLDELQAGDLAVKATFELGYGQLEPPQARAFRLLGLADGPDISLAAAAALLNLETHAAEDLLEALVDTSLLESAAPGRYRYHDLVRLYARSCAERDEELPEERELALSRLLDFYLATAAGVYALERPGDRTVDHLEPSRYPGLTFKDRPRALDWLYAEADCLLACVLQSLGPRALRRAVDLLMTVKDLAESGANARRYETAALALRDAAMSTGDARAEGRARTTLTQVYSTAGRFEQADSEAHRAMELGIAANDPWTSGNAPNERGILAIYRNQHAEGEAYLQKAIAAFRADGNKPGEASALCNLSRIHLALFRTDSAVDLAEQGIEIYDRLGLALRLANGRYALGLALAKANRLAEALEQLTQALGIFHENRQPLWEGVTHFRLAEVHLTAGRHTMSAAHAEQAIALRGIGGEWRRGTVLTVLGKALVQLEQPDRARACWAEALAIYEQLGSIEAGEVRGLLSPATAA
ncbi:tetratricopeptide repeat protein [Streptomyces poriferorum]|uniref:tetratricopeptide repeat protein n=1 Tax=Streptomyces poriferorum TaxID=2798799 RepID=UPI0027E2141D|nr:tetratricopeptide repeat protein [Streptomyces poriferorum]